MASNQPLLLTPRGCLLVEWTGDSHSESMWSSKVESVWRTAAFGQKQLYSWKKTLFVSASAKSIHSYYAQGFSKIHSVPNKLSKIHSVPSKLSRVVQARSKLRVATEDSHMRPTKESCIQRQIKVMLREQWRVNSLLLLQLTNCQRVTCTQHRGAGTIENQKALHLLR